MHFTSIDGVTLHHEHRLAGRGGQHLVFINSLGTDFRIWRDVIDDLGGSISTLAYDKRGHGLSDIGTTPYSIEDHVDDLSGLLDHLGIDDAVLCGLSVGGMVALGLAVRRPDIVKGLVLCDTAHKIGTADGWNARIAAVEKDGIASIADGILKLWFTPQFHTEREQALAGCRNMLLRQPASGYTATCAALRDADYTEAATMISVATLCVVGDQDGSTPPALVRSMADLIPGAQFKIIDGAGHIPCIEQPATLVALIRRFLALLPCGDPGSGVRR